MRILKTGFIGMALLAGASPLAAQQASPTIQQSFDAATALGANGDNAGALAAWQSLEKRAGSNRRTLAIIRVRIGAALYELGRLDEAVIAIRSGLADLPASDHTLDLDRYDAYFQLGQVAEAGLDYASAAVAYRTAEPLAGSPGDHLATFRGLVSAETFTDSDRAMVDMTRADALLATVPAEAKVRATFAMLKSVLLLNRGQFSASRVAAGEAVKLLGGLTDKTDLYDVAARSDYAIAALLNGRPDDAREYMAATGAGRLPKGNFDPGVQMKAPECGGDAGLRPNDAAVIEFSISDDGSVASSVPVYAAGGGAAGLEFARAARSWSWTPEQLKQLPAFFRYRARVELRCSTSFERPSIGTYLDSALDAWLGEKGVAVPSTSALSDAAALPQQRAQLTAAEAAKGNNALALVPLLHAMMKNSVVGREETNALARRALAIADANGATPIVRVALSRFVWNTARADIWKHGAYDAAVSPALADPSFDSAEAHAAIALVLADGLRGSDKARTKNLLQQVTAETALPPNHPLRVGALVRLASLEASSGDAAAARAAFDQSGLSSRQCALVDSAPRLKHFGGGAGDFPQGAQQWGFEGWVVTQFDVAADGTVQNARAIVSYPPFIFSAAGAKVIGNSRYEKTYRPDGGLGCGGNVQKTGFRIENF